MTARRTLPFPVLVTEHARERARERFPGFKAARIIEEVRDAFHEGRFSGRKPAGVVTDKDEGYSFFCWTPDGGRVYALRTCYRHVAVVTTMRVDRRAA
jgi:hypothetical protein